MSLTVRSNSIKRNDLTEELLKEWLLYNPLSGEFLWVKTNANGSTRRGRQAGYTDTDGYVYIKLFGIKYRAHILAWLYMTGSFPQGVIDHNDQVKSNNVFSNLQDVTQAENSRNIANQNTSNTGHQGIWFNRRTGRYHASITKGGKKVWQRIYDDCAVALAERKSMLIHLGFNINHGINTKRLTNYE